MNKDNTLAISKRQKELEKDLEKLDMAQATLIGGALLIMIITLVIVIVVFIRDSGLANFLYVTLGMVVFFWLSRVIGKFVMRNF